MNVQVFIQETRLLQKIIEDKTKGNKNFIDDNIKKINSVELDLKKLKSERISEFKEFQSIKQEIENLYDDIKINDEDKILEAMEKKGLLETKMFITRKNVEKIDETILKTNSKLEKLIKDVRKYFSLHHELYCREIVIDTRKYIHGYIVGCIEKEDFTKYNDKENEESIVGNYVSQMFADLEAFEELCDKNNITLYKEKSHEILELIKDGELVIKNGGKIDLVVNFNVSQKKIHGLHARKYFGHHKILFDEKYRSIYKIDVANKNIVSAKKYENEICHMCEAEKYYELYNQNENETNSSCEYLSKNTFLKRNSNTIIYNTCTESDRVNGNKIIEGKRVNGV